MTDGMIIAFAIAGVYFVWLFGMVFIAKSGGRI